MFPLLNLAVISRSAIADGVTFLQGADEPMYRTPFKRMAALLLCCALFAGCLAQTGAGSSSAASSLPRPTPSPLPPVQFLSGDSAEPTPSIVPEQPTLGYSTVEFALVGHKIVYVRFPDDWVNHPADFFYYDMDTRETVKLGTLPDVISYSRDYTVVGERYIYTVIPSKTNDMHDATNRLLRMDLQDNALEEIVQFHGASRLGYIEPVSERQFLLYQMELRITDTAFEHPLLIVDVESGEVTELFHKTLTRTDVSIDWNDWMIREDHPFSGTALMAATYYDGVIYTSEADLSPGVWPPAYVVRAYDMQGELLETYSMDSPETAGWLTMPGAIFTRYMAYIKVMDDYLLLQEFGLEAMLARLEDGQVKPVVSGHFQNWMQPFYRAEDGKYYMNEGANAYCLDTRAHTFRELPPLFGADYGIGTVTFNGKDGLLLAGSKRDPEQPDSSEMQLRFLQPAYLQAASP